jgi:hypothetical protein
MLIDIVAYRPITKQGPRNKQRETAVAMQEIGKQASTTTELLLEAVFSIRPVQSGYKKENWSNQFN